ncbi:MAG: PucR family transcriptional regulator [Thermoanaerobacteraceae bacterium]
MINYDIIRKIAKEVQKNIKQPLYIIDKSGQFIYNGNDFFEKKEGFLSIKREYMNIRDFYEENGFTFYNIFLENKLSFIIFLEGTSQDTKEKLELISMIFSNPYEQFTKEKFFYDLIMGTLNEEDIFYYSLKYGIDKKAEYVVSIIESNENVDDAIKIVTNIFDKENLNLIIIGEKKFALLLFHNKEMNIFNEYRTIKDMIESELLIKVDIGISSNFIGLEKAPNAFKEASIALKLGKILETDKNLYFYNNLLFAELISNVSRTEAENFIQKLNVDSLVFNDEELVQTLNAFFKNSLNLSETSRELYVHRNTLVYRLDKIYRLSGLDPKKFDEALLLKTIMILVKLFDLSR